MARGFPQELLKAVNRSSLLSSMERHKVLQANKHLEQTAAAHLHTPALLPRTSMDQFCRIAASRREYPLLKTIHLGEMPMDSCSQGCVLHGMLRGSAFKLDRIVVAALEDQCGKVARLMLQNAIESTTPSEQLRFRYPENASVTITEPCLVKQVLGIEGPTLWITNPGSFQVVSRFPDMYSAGKQACDFFELAKEKSAAGNFWAAVELYTRSINLVLTSKESVPALCKRAQAHLKLGFNLKALEDATSAAALDPQHVESILVKAEAMMSLGLYQGAEECYKYAVELVPGDAAIVASYEESRTFHQQSLHGFPNISSVAALSDNRDEKAYPDYVGPVEARMTTDQKGRGLFTTAPVTKGQLLLAYNATVANDGSSIRGPDLLSRVISSCLACSLTLARIRGMIEIDSVPDMEVFRPNWKVDKLLPELKSQDELVGLDVAGLEWLVTRSVSLRYGIWTLPAFLNHSCLPNVTCGGLGTVQYVYAARDLETGTELVTSYWSVLKPWNPSRRSCPETFKCNCERCALEERLDKPLERVCRRYELVIENKLSSSLTTELAQLAMEVEKLSQHLDVNDEERQWLRASFSEAYLAYYREQAKGNTDVEMPAVETFLEAMHVTAPGNGNDKTLELMLDCAGTTRHGYNEVRVQQLLQQEKLLRYGRT